MKRTRQELVKNGVHFVRPGHGPGGSGGRRRGGGSSGGGGAVRFHRGHAVPVDRGDGDHAPLRSGGGAVPAAAAGAVRPVPPGVRGPGGDGQHLRQRVRQSAGAGQRGHPPGYRGGAADGAKEPRDGVGCHVHAGGMQHRLHPADPHHRGLGAGGGGEFGPL